MPDDLNQPFGNYLLTEVLGEGAMARVYRALRSGPMGFRKPVAIKQIRPEVATSKKVVQALINEARLGGYLQHRNLVQIDEFDQVDGVYYIAMELVQGFSLAEILERSRDLELPLPPRIVADIGAQLCDGLAYAHSAVDENDQPMGLVHRDLKPSNVMVSHDGVVKIMDFGIAKAATNLFQTSVVGITKGTPVYMSPEQVRGEPLDRRSDLFAVGSILGELATGVVVFQDDKLHLTLQKVVNADIDELTAAIQPRIPGLVPILERALQADRSRRYADAADMFRDLAQLRASLPGDENLGPWLRVWFSPQGPPRDTRATAAPAAGDDAPPSSLERGRAPGTSATPPPRPGTLPAAAPPPGEPEPAAARPEEVPPPRPAPTVELDLVEIGAPNAGTSLDLQPPPDQAGLTLELEALEPETGGAGGAAAVVAHAHGIVMVEIPAGTFWMGSPEGEEGRHEDEVRHRVVLERPFLMATTPVTQAQWRAVIGTTPSSHEGDDLPVEMVSWFDALEFCNRLSVAEGLRPAYGVDGGRLIWDRESPGFRLPTEAEWEYAARAGRETRFAGSDDVSEVGWHYHNARGRSHAVRGLAPNAWGLYDMSGNVWEWSWDLYGPYPDDEPAINPAGLSRGTAHVCRGGSWYSMAEDLRVARRYHRARGTDRAHFLGFRLVRSSF